jgi:hypothetical protein
MRPFLTLHASCCSASVNQLSLTMYVAVEKMTLERERHFLSHLHAESLKASTSQEPLRISETGKAVPGLGRAQKTEIATRKGKHARARSLQSPVAKEGPASLVAHGHNLPRILVWVPDGPNKNRHFKAGRPGCGGVQCSVFGSDHLGAPTNSASALRIPHWPPPPLHTTPPLAERSERTSHRQPPF